MHHVSFVSAPYFLRFCRIYAIIVIKNDFVIHQHSLGPSGSVENRGRVLKTSGYALGFQHSPRDLANVNEWKIIFDPYIKNDFVIHLHWLGPEGSVENRELQIMFDLYIEICLISILKRYNRLIIFRISCITHKINYFRQYEERELLVQQERAKKRLEFENQKFRLQNQIEFERSRDTWGNF